MFKISDIGINKMSQVSKPLAEIISPGDVFVLQGEIGAGKTTLITKIAEQLGVKDEVTSPTFAIVAQYDIIDSLTKIKKLIHIDTYRLLNLNELYELGFETLFDQDCVTFIEWGERIVDHIEIEHFTISIDESKADTRSYEVSISGNLNSERSKLIQVCFLDNGWSIDE